MVIRHYSAGWIEGDETTFPHHRRSNIWLATISRLPINEFDFRPLELDGVRLILIN